MPYKFNNIPINNKKYDRRVKLSDQDREEIRELYKKGNISQQALADKYNVSKRLIHFVIHPEKEVAAREQFKMRQKDRRYYDKDKHRRYMKKHRDHKKELYKNNLLKVDDNMITKGTRIKVAEHITDEQMNS